MRVNDCELKTPSFVVFWFILAKIGLGALFTNTIKEISSLVE